MAVYTVVDRPSLDLLLDEYRLGQLRAFEPIAEGVENSNYRLVTERGRFILTLYERRVDPDDLPFFLGLMEHLSGRGVPCPVPLKDTGGCVLREVCGRPAAVTTFLDGRSPGRIEAEHCRTLGAALARLHVAGAGFALHRANALSVPGWRALFEACRGADAGGLPDGLLDETERELGEVEAAWPGDLPAGVVHADLFPDNVFFTGTEVTGLIDFYFACVDLFAYDLAICLNAWCFEPDGAFNITKARRMLQAYREVRPFTPAELEALPLLARGAALRFLLTRLFDWQHRVAGALVRPKDPIEYLRKLRFHRTVRSPAAYGLD